MPVEYTTTDELKSLGTGLTEEVRKSVTAAATSASTFLSHSSKDSDILPGAIRVLRNHGANVYIDKKDPALPPYTTRETAQILKKRISQTKKFVLLASVNSKDSRWVPWELGLADGYKRLENVAIFPSVDSRHETNWTKQEYLGIYDRIVFGDMEGHSDRIWMVLNHEKFTATPLLTWLKR